MTFTEAAVEVLRRAGRPLHFKEIADLAVQENLLSHVGQDPEVTMGQRLAAMAKREEDRKVVAVAPDGTFALLEWNVPAEAVVEPVAPPLQPADPVDGLYRPREREPRAIHAQARRRLQELQAEHEPDSVFTQEAERDVKEREDRDRHRRSQKGQRRFPPPAEVVFEALAMRQTGARLQELAEQLLERSLLSEALVRDMPSLVDALLEDNRRRTEAGRKPAFIVDGERVSLVEFPPPPVPGVLAEFERAPQTGMGRPPTSTQLVAETRRAVVRALRRRLAELETGSFEQVCSALLDKMGMRDVRVAKRGKEGPLYLARQRRGVSDLRVAVRLVRGTREIGRQDVQELRKDLAHYSAQMGLVLAPGEAGREARAEASGAGQPPVALYVGDALAEEMVAVRVGVQVQMVELVDIDEGFFQSTARPPQRDDRRREQQREPDAALDAQQPGPVEPVDLVPTEVATGTEQPVVEETPLVDVGASPSAAEQQSIEPRLEPADTAAPQGEPPPKDDERRDRGRRGGRDRDRDREARRAAMPSEQAWGQPAGTPRPPGVPYAPVAVEGRPMLARTLDPPPPPPEALAPPADSGGEPVSGAGAGPAPSQPEAPAAAEAAERSPDAPPPTDRPL
jgi:hypothetical protein